jgi:hypothetical protein
MKRHKRELFVLSAMMSGVVVGGLASGASAHAMATIAVILILSGLAARAILFFIERR